MLERLGSLGVLERLGVGASIVYDVAANWKALVENFTECCHCPSIHPELTAALPEFASGFGSISGGRFHGASLAEGLDAFSRSGKATRQSLPGLDEEADGLFYGVILLPNVFLVLVPDHVAFFRLEPIAVDRTRVTCDWLFEPSALETPGFDASDSVELLDITNRQDFEACERCQMGISSRSFREGGSGGAVWAPDRRIPRLREARPRPLRRGGVAGPELTPVQRPRFPWRDKGRECVERGESGRYLRRHTTERT